jgi:ribosome biogenesis GTPase A
MSQLKNLNYFPGHMKKALSGLPPFLKVADLVVEIADARAPISSRNPRLQSEIGSKPHILFLAKSDYADPFATQKWLAYFAARGLVALEGDLKKDKVVAALQKAAKPLLEAKRAKEKRQGMKPQPCRLIVVGIPNVGKSTFINNVAGKNVAVAANRPGVTRAEQWIKLGSDFILFDTPGILPMNYPDGSEAVRLALLGAIKEEVLPIDDLSYALLGFLRGRYPESLKNRYGIGDLNAFSSDEALKAIAKTRGLLSPGGTFDVSRASALLVREFQDGLLGRLSLEESDA